MSEPNWKDLTQRLYRYFAARWAPAVAADLTQDTLQRVFEKMSDGSFQTKLGTLTSYAFGIAVNVSREQTARKVRTLRRESEWSDANDVSDKSMNPEERLTLQRSISALRKAFQHLSETEQEIMALLVDQDLSLIEIASILLIPVGTVKSHVSRAKASLRDLLNKEDAYAKRQ